MPTLQAQVDRRRIAIRHPMAGVSVGRMSGVGPLVRAVPERYATALHLSGRSEWTSGRSKWSVAPGSISVKVPGEVYTQTAREGLSSSQVVLFDTALVDDARAALGRRAATAHSHSLNGDDARMAPLAELHRLLLSDDEDCAPAFEQAVCAALTAFVDITFASRGLDHNASAWTVAVARARAWLDERITETVTLDDLAAHARLDKFHLCRAFRDEVGLPPHAYVTHRRVSSAQTLLARGIPQAEVAYLVGLYDQSQLHRHFKRIVGMTPGEFARAARH